MGSRLAAAALSHRDGPGAMLPRDVRQVWEEACTPHQHEVAASGGTLEHELDQLVAWLFSSTALSHRAVQRYLFYCWSLRDTFSAIQRMYPQRLGGNAASKDYITVQSNPSEMMFLANALYVAHSYDMPGVLLEAGCFKGFSTCCLSHACQRLGRELIVADSFQGLPSTEGETGADSYYQAGDFAATFEEVKENVHTFGNGDTVSYLPGWFSNSLEGWSRPVAVLWLDVDLYSSATDVLTHVHDHLAPASPIFTHEVAPSDIDADGRIRSSERPIGAIRDFLNRRNVAYVACHCIGDLGVVWAAPSIPAASIRLLPRLLELLGQEPAAGARDGGRRLPDALDRMSNWMARVRSRSRR